jgi:DNA-directed RNA polymerase sigma subunit (sigma70/sigma32)
MKTYSKEEELKLWGDWKLGSKVAQNKLIKSLDPLLQSQINRYQHPSIPRSALEAEARKLALEAFKTYDPSKAQLGTHVTNHQKHLQRYVLNYVNIGKIPENRALAVGKFQKIKQNLMEDLGREPNTVELADSLTWAPREVERMENELRKDLAITTGGEEEAFFENIMFSTDTTSEILFFAYYEADQEEKLIFEYSFGWGGKPKLDVKDIALRIGKPEVYVRRKRIKFAEKVNKAKRMGII